MCYHAMDVLSDLRRDEDQFPQKETGNLDLISLARRHLLRKLAHAYAVCDAKLGDTSKDMAGLFR